jgi:uncharacterized protein (DUF1330 family)
MPISPLFPGNCRVITTYLPKSTMDNASPADTGAYLIGNIRINDQEKWIAYRDSVPATLTPFAGTVVFRGRKVAVFSGSNPCAVTVVIRFPDEQAMRAWHDSAAYQSLIALRDQAAEVVLTGYAV